MLYATLWPLVVLYALVADAAVISGPRYKGPRAAKRETVQGVDKRLLLGLLPGPATTTTASLAQQSATYLAQAQAAEVGRNLGWTAVGCIRDSPTRTLAEMSVSWDNMTLPICMNTCFGHGYTYGGVQWGRECWCGNTIRTGVWVGTPPNSYIKSGDTYGTLVPYSECQTYPCAGDKSTACGNNWRNNVFQVTDTTAANAAISASASASSAAAYSSSAAAYSSAHAGAIASSASQYSASSNAAYSSSTSAAAAAATASSLAHYSSNLAYSTSSSAAAYSQSLAAAQSSAAAYSQSTSAAAYSQSAAAYSNSVANAQASASAYSQSAAAYSQSTSAAAYSQSAAAYSNSVANAQASASAYSQSTSAAAYSQSAAAYSQSVIAYSSSAAAAAAAAEASNVAYSASSAAAYSKSVADEAYSQSAGAAYSASVSLAAYSQSINDAAAAATASASNAAYSASVSAAAYSQSIADQAAAASASANDAAVAASSSAAAAAAAASATAIPQGWSAARTACIAEGTTGRAMTGASIASPDMSFGRCIKFCSDAGFALAGVEYSTECMCSNVLENGGSLDRPSAQCNMKCGGSDQTCGGPNAITLFYKDSALDALSSDFTAKPVILTNGWEVASTACVAEGTSGRALPGASFSAPDMLPSKCMDFCASRNFKYAGLEYASECYCNNELANGASLDRASDSCNMGCSGNPSVNCGGPNGINLFVNPTIGDNVAASAASASKAASDAQASASQAASDAQNSAAAALQAKLPAGWKPAATTCLHEVSGRALTGASTAGGDMTVQKCASFCSEKGFTLAGLEYSGECYCGNDLSNGASMDKTSDQCNMKCSGDDSTICGGPDAISLFSGPAAQAAAAPAATASTTTSAAPSGPTLAANLPEGWSAAETNCIQEVGGRALTGYSEASGDMTIPKCLSICSGRGFKLAAVEYSAECYCGNELVNGASMDKKSEQCVMPCGGDSTTLCGGPNALQLYSNPNAVAPTTAAASSAAPAQTDAQNNNGQTDAANGAATTTATSTQSAPSAGPTPETNLPDGWAAASTTCLQEVPGRALVGYATTQDDMDINKCLNICEGRGFYYAAVQWGKECQCGNSLMNGASLDKASNNCNMGCAGKPDTLCGGSDALQLYTNPSLDPAVRGVNGFAYGGCIQEVVGRALNMTRLDDNNMTVEKCTDFCMKSGYTMAGLEYGTECFCGNSLVGGASTDLKSYECKMPCPGNSAQMCGGPDAINLYAMQS